MSNRAATPSALEQSVGSHIHVAAVIVAAGEGTRFGGAKQLVPLAGKPLYLHSLQTFAAVSSIERIALVVPSSLQDEMGQVSQFATPIDVVVGGAIRRDSVLAGIRKLARDPAITHVLVHDAARALVTCEIIARAVGALMEHEAVVVAMPVVDTLKRVVGKEVVSTISRTEIYRAQTPQGARTELLLDALSVYEEGTDESEFLERAGCRPWVVEGSEENFKITYPEDLARAEFFLRNRQLKKV